MKCEGQLGDPHARTQRQSRSGQRSRVAPNRGAGPCVGRPPAWSGVDVDNHFNMAKTRGGWECRHCSAAGRGNKKLHMASCPRLPESDRRALDESEAERAAAGVGVYGTNQVYRDFEVTGGRVARCTACPATVRGPSGNLQRHRRQRCSGPRSGSQRQRAERGRGQAGTSGCCDTLSLTPRPRHAASVGAPVRSYDALGGIPVQATTQAAPATAVQPSADNTLPSTPGASTDDTSEQSPARTASLLHQHRVSNVVGGAVQLPRTALTVGFGCTGSGGGDGGSTPAGVARRRWAEGVRATGGPEAVAAALRVRYPRLYESSAATARTLLG